MKRTLSLIMAALILSSVASCGTTAENPETTTENQQDTMTTPAESNKFDDELPDRKFDGRTITFGVSIASEGDIIAEEENGDVVNDAMVARNRAVEERFDVKIESHLVSDDLYDWYEKLTTSVLAGDGICDIAGHYAYLTYTAAQNGIYVD